MIPVIENFKKNNSAHCVSNAHVRMPPSQRSRLRFIQIYAIYSIPNCSCVHEARLTVQTAAHRMPKCGNPLCSSTDPPLAHCNRSDLPQHLEVELGWTISGAAINRSRLRKNLICRPFGGKNNSPEKHSAVRNIAL